MKSIFSFILSISITSISLTQSIDTSSIHNLKDIQLRQTNFSKIAMISLNSWAVGNITYGTIANFQTTGEAKYFHQMNAIWNVVNLGIGVPSIIGVYKHKDQQSFETLFKNQKKMETVYLFNAGLDLAYITAGAASRLYGNSLNGNDALRFKGYGSSLIFQGGYLFVHDLAMFFLLKTNTKLLDKEWKNVTLNVNPTGAVIKFK